MSGKRDVCPEYHSAYMLYRTSRGKKLMSSKTSLTTPGLALVRLTAGRSNRLQRSRQRDLFCSDPSWIKLPLPIRTSFARRHASCPILWPERLRKDEQRAKTSSTDWQMGMLSAQSSQ